MNNKQFSYSKYPRDAPPPTFITPLGRKAGRKADTHETTKYTH